MVADDDVEERKRKEKYVWLQFERIVKSQKYLSDWNFKKPMQEWRGVSTTEEGFVRYINLYDGNCEGSIPEEIGELVYLEHFTLKKNPNLVGPIPESMKHLTKLKTLELHLSELTGRIPDFIGLHLTNLQRLDLSFNKLSGRIPSSIKNLVHLKSVTFSNNQLEGPIPDCIGELKNLESFYCSDNKLTGLIPKSIGNLTNLRALYVSDNKLAGSVPESIKQLSKLTCLYIGGTNELSGNVFDDIQFSGRRYFPALKYCDVAKEGTLDVSKKSVSTTWEILTLVWALILGYIDIISDIVSAYVIYESGQRGIFAVQVVIFVLETLMVAGVGLQTGENMLEIFSSLTQTRFLVEAVRSWWGYRETTAFAVIKLIEVIVEACPSALLQLVVVLTSDEDLSSGNSLFLLFSVFISTVSVSTLLWNQYPAKDEFKDKLSPVLLFASHYAGMSFRLATFVAMFAAIGGYGFFLLVVSLLVRWMLVAGSGKSDTLLCNATSFTNACMLMICTAQYDDSLIGSHECGVDEDNDGALVGCQMLDVVDFVLAVVTLFEAKSDVHDSSKTFIAALGCTMWFFNIWFTYDRGSESKWLNGWAIARQETFVSKMKSSGVCGGICFTSEDDAQQNQQGQGDDEGNKKDAEPAIESSTSNPLSEASDKV